MDFVNEALHTIGTWLELLIGVLLGIFGVIEGFFRSILVQAGIPENLQQIIMLVITVLLIIAIVRLFGGVFRFLLVLFLILLLLHVLVQTLAPLQR
jgi:hypothetical protein